MRAFTITGPMRGELAILPDPAPRPDEAVIRVDYAGICGTDYRIFAGDFHTAYPLVSGHEFSGVIAALGDDASGWRVGDRVTVDPTLYCGRCYHCLRRQGNHCDAWGAVGDTRDGGFAQYVAVPLRNVYRVEDHEAMDEAALTEPLACVVWGIERLRIRPGDRALIFGAGPVGALLTQMLDRSSAADIVLVDVSAAKLAIAASLGARATYLNDGDLAGRLDERSAGRKFDIVIDCTGDPSVMAGLFRFAAPGARIMFFGVAPRGAEIAIRPFDVYRQDWEILGSMAINYTFQQARDLLAAGRLDVRPLISRVAGLEEVPEILGTAKSGTDLKIMVRPNADGG